jgi:NRPS condensation-like uncharacterized protein
VIQAPAARPAGAGPGGELDEAALHRGAAEALPFDLQQGPLLRVTLLRLAADDHVLVMTLHHIVADGWSMNVMVDELVALCRLQPGPARAIAGAADPVRRLRRVAAPWMDAGERERQLSWTAQPAVAINRCWSCRPTVRVRSRAIVAPVAISR